MILYRDLHFSLDASLEDVKRLLAKKLKIDISDIISVEYYKKSIDARNKNDVFFIGSFYLELKNEKKVLNNSKVKKVDINTIHPLISKDTLRHDSRPIVVGSGPSGLFCALYLAKKGLNPIVIEQGKDVESRSIDVEEFMKSGKLNPNSNVQFGEGGAGTFSDGKLNTSSNNPLIRVVLEEFVAHGAPKEILYLSKPHVGTDKLKEVIKNIRNDIINLGGEFKFETEMTNLLISDNKVTGVEVKHHNNLSVIHSSAVFLCIGHSARKTYKMLYENNVSMAKKPFAMGVRIELLQEDINKAQYGKFYNHPALGAADYKLVTHLDNGRTVYTFCMCPGGEVICSSSEDGGLTVNGMSYHARNSMFANSALLVNVTTDDILGESPLDAIEYQRKYEKLAYNLSSNHYAVAQHIDDFLNNQVTIKLRRLTSYKPEVFLGKIDDCLPEFICDSLRKGLVELDKKLEGFANKDGLLLGVETRSSSPIRILRNEEFQSVNIKGLYPCGEGAGYAGGITTSAIDGIRAAKAFCNTINEMVK